MVRIKSVLQVLLVVYSRHRGHVGSNLGARGLIISTTVSWTAIVPFITFLHFLPKNKKNSINE